MKILDFIKRYPVIIYFVLTFAISWGGFILVLGFQGFTSADVWQETSLGFVVAAMLAGPSIAGLLMIGITERKSGFQKLFSQILKWRVNVIWYIIALLPAPILSVIVLFILSLNSPVFSGDNKIAVIFSGIFAGLTTIFEEIGWTGFTVPKLRRKYSIITTGLIIGILWGLWHLLQQIYISNTYTGEVPITLYLFLAVFNTIAGLTAYRILLVWIYDRTKSLLITTLMHASLTASNVFIFRPEAEGMTFLFFGLLFTATQWIFVIIIFLINRRHFLS